MTLENIQNYVLGRIEWLKRNHKNAIANDLHETETHKRVHETYRDCKIVLRKANLANKILDKNQEPKEVWNDLYESYRTLRYKQIPSFTDWLTLTKGKR